MSLFTSLVDYSLYFIKVLVPRGPEEKCPFPTLSLQNVAPGSWGSKVGDVLFDMVCLDSRVGRQMGTPLHTCGGEPQ